jgi:type I restriction enzyme M protein
MMPRNISPEGPELSQNLSSLIWTIAELLRGDYRQADYGKVILPFTLLRRLDCVLEKTKAAVLKELEIRTKGGSTDPSVFLTRAAGYKFYNTSKLDFQKILGDPDHVYSNLISYIQSFSPNVADIFERFEFDKQLDRLNNSKLLYKVVQQFAEVDLHPSVVSNMEMGTAFEELIRRFAELSNETAGEHFTPREVIRLLVNLLFADDKDVLTKPGTIRSFYDPTAGTGGILSIAEEYLRELNPQASLILHGQELNPESYAVCKADMLVKGQDVSKIVFGNTLSNDGHAGATFDYCGSNPPYGVEWKKIEQEIVKEHERLGMKGRFGPGLPRVSDGSLLFVLHLLSKMRPVKTKKDGTVEGGGRVAIVLNGSPLFTGGAGSGESEIRRHIIENDLLEAIVALPTDMFYNTGISTYIWILSNNKPQERRGKVQLINAAGLWQKMRKSLGSKRKEMSAEHIDEVTRIYGEFSESARSKIFDNEDFGYYAITIERPLRLSFGVTPERLDRLTHVKALKDGVGAIRKALATLPAKTVWNDRNAFTRSAKKELAAADVNLSPAQLKAVISTLGERDETAEVCIDAKGCPEADSDLRDVENVPLKEDVQAFFDREVRPHAPDAWIDTEKTKVGYEIPFTQHFFEFEAPREPEEIDADLKAVSAEIMELLEAVTHA